MLQLYSLQDKNEAVELNSTQSEKFGSQLQLNRINSSSNINLHTMSSLQEDETNDSKSITNHEVSTPVIPTLKVDLFNSNETNLNEDATKNNEIEQVSLRFFKK